MKSADGWSQLVAKGRDWESFYRERWQHDKVRSTHGVNCTGSCSWNVYGDSATFGYNVFGSGYDYRATVGPWFRSLWFDPHPSPMANAPFLYQLHAALPWLLYAICPFSRLVHAWSYPLQYLGRPYILYRRRYPAMHTLRPEAGALDAPPPPEPRN